MKAQSYLVPFEEEIVLDNKGKEIKVKKHTYFNKGRDEQFYENRRKKNECGDLSKEDGSQPTVVECSTTNSDTTKTSGSD